MKKIAFVFVLFAVFSCGKKAVEKPENLIDKEVMAEIDKEREKNARFVDVDRAVENGDRVVLDYSGSIGGEKFEGGTAEDQHLVIGSNTTPAGELLPEADGGLFIAAASLDRLVLPHYHQVYGRVKPRPRLNRLAPLPGSHGVGAEPGARR